MISGSSPMSDSWCTHLSSQLLPAQVARREAPARGQAAVLVPILFVADQPHVILTRRAAHLQHHPGEIAFPGGMWESDDINLAQTALRESFEETGMPSDAVQLLGRMKPFSTRRGVSVTPVVGVVHGTPRLTPDPAELDLIFQVPLAQLTPEAAARYDTFDYAEGRVRVPVFESQGHTIWGLTAAIIANLNSLIC
ncbi:CoA pyrophosphatase [Gilvimarinus xylanilyticus]|uniref:CoA pyrophosphatase n=1 Tax=Gilvimarinus xylanilyticus TaxID=2944139 RepID=A0A9X2KSA7_9GAMM|nr:CoA pyrophosphatase [Gilvimarinus xylanilyticus]MCP8898049.1 CoA pyrophosphatase [Gilvimarinus xylanilyticus]